MRKYMLTLVITQWQQQQFISVIQYDLHCTVYSTTCQKHCHMTKWRRIYIPWEGGRGNSEQVQHTLWALRCCYTRQFFLQLATQRHCEKSCRRNCVCNTPSLQLVSQRKIARRVAGKVEQSSTFRNVAWSVAACNIYLATCNDLLSSALRCKLQEKLPRVTGPLHTVLVANNLLFWWKWTLSSHFKQHMSTENPYNVIRLYLYKFVSCDCHEVKSETRILDV